MNVYKGLSYVVNFSIKNQAFFLFGLMLDKYALIYYCIGAIDIRGAGSNLLTFQAI